MRHTTRAILLLLVIGAVPVLADTIISGSGSFVDCGSTCIAPFATFEFDAALFPDPFVYLTVVWDGITFNLAGSSSDPGFFGSANLPYINSTYYAACDPPSEVGGFSSYVALTNCAGQQEDGSYNEWIGQVYTVEGVTWAAFNFYVIAPNGSTAWQVGAEFPVDPPAPVTDQGSFSFTTVSASTVPEPGTAVLTLCGLFVAGLLFRRNACEISN